MTMQRLATTAGVLVGGVSLLCLGMAMERARAGRPARSPMDGGGVTRLGPRGEEGAGGAASREREDADPVGPAHSPSQGGQEERDGQAGWPFPTSEQDPKLP